LVFGQASSNSLAANFDIAYHYSGVAKFKPESGSIDLQWQIELNDSAADNFTFVLRSSLHSINVTGESLASFSVSESELGEDFQQIDISVKPVEKNHSRAIRLTYQGILLPKPMSNLINQISAEAIELNVDSFWHPIDPRFNQLMTVELDIQIESDWLAVGAGELLKTDTGFVLTNNKPALDVSFALSKKYKISQMSGYTLYDLRDNKGGTEKLTSAVSFCSSRLNDDFGQSNPLGHIHFTINNRPSSGYARGNYIALTDISDSPEDRLTQFICHEIAHHWSFRGKFDTEENWLNESFAEYIGMMMLRERFGEQSFTTRINQFHNQIKDKTLKPIWSSDITERPDYLVSYRKGPLALWKLEQKIGREPFKQFIILYMTKNTSSTEQLLAQLLSISDTKTVEWFTTLLAK
jgi:hypothetical protein